jgi:SSS family transporter
VHAAGFSSVDWAVFGAYFVVLALTSVLFSRMRMRTSYDYFAGGRNVPFWAAAVSLLATTQSAATFLGGPEYAYNKDLTFLGFYLSAFLAVWIVVKVLLPRLYAIDAVTVYELLETRFGARAKRDAGVMFLIGRLFASGARLYIGALAVSMILFLDIQASHVALSVVILMAAAVAYAYFGGVKSVIFSDIIQAVTYIGAAVAVALYLFFQLGGDAGAIIAKLEAAHKLKCIDTSLSGGFSVYSLFTGWLLLNIAAYGLDQDMTQRALTCKNAREAARSMLLGIYLTVPVAFLFLVIGLLLYLYYHDATLTRTFEGEKITVFMYYILHEMPEGLRGLVTVGAVAAALSSSNSVLAAMASVAVEDLYKPWISRRKKIDDAHLIKAGRAAVLIFAAALSLMAMLSFYWQRYSDLPLLSFALGVMAFAYTGLLGVYAAALFTKRGSAASVRAALIAGFVTVLALQPYMLGSLSGIKLNFAWQIVIGTLVAFLTALAGKESRGVKN